MKLDRILIQNFKSISPTGVEIAFKSGILVLVGKNNAGKSNILEAAGLVLGNKNPRYVSIPTECFNDPSQEIVIRGRVHWTDVGRWQTNWVVRQAMRLAYTRRKTCRNGCGTCHLSPYRPTSVGRGRD